MAGDGTYTSDPFIPTQPGTYQWVVSYSGDANNQAATTICADPAGATTVTPGGVVTPTIVTTASPGVTLGGSVTDTATLSGGSNPTGTITFTLYGPNDATCSPLPPSVGPSPAASSRSRWW